MFLDALGLLSAVLIYLLIAIICTAVGMEIFERAMEVFGMRRGRDRR